MVESSSKATNVSDDTASHDEDWLVSSNLVVLELNQDLLDVLDVLVDLVATVDELDQLDAVSLEVLLEILAEVDNDLVVDQGDASAEGLVDVSEDVVLRVEDTIGDLDGSGQGGAHDGLDGLRVSSGEGQTVAVSVDGGGVDGVRVDGLEGLVVLNVLLGIREVLALSHDKLLKSNLAKFVSIFNQINQRAVEVLYVDLEFAEDLLDEEQVLAEWQVSVELELFSNGK